MSHGAGGGSVLLRPDGTPMSKEEVIIKRRGALKWLPVLCSNDLVHGSWYVVYAYYTHDTHMHIHALETLSKRTSGRLFSSSSH